MCRGGVIAPRMLVCGHRDKIDVILYYLCSKESRIDMISGESVDDLEYDVHDDGFTQEGGWWKQVEDAPDEKRGTRESPCKPSDSRHGRSEEDEGRECGSASTSITS